MTLLSGDKIERTSRLITFTEHLKSSKDRDREKTHLGETLTTGFSAINSG